MDLLSQRPSFDRIYLLRRNEQLITDFNQLIIDLKKLIFDFFNIPINSKIITFNKNYIKELEYKIGTIINLEKQQNETTKLKEEFIIKLGNFEKLRIISEYLSIFDYSRNNFINFLVLDSSKELTIKTHSEYRKFLIPRLNNCINRADKLILHIGELCERPINYIDYSYVRKLFNQKIVLIKQIDKVPIDSLKFIKSNSFEINKFNSNIARIFFKKLNKLMNDFEEIRERILYYFERESIIIEHGMFKKLNTNVARKTENEKSNLQKQLQTNLHNTRTIVYDD